MKIRCINVKDKAAMDENQSEISAFIFAPAK